MQASTFCVKGNVGFHVGNHGVLAGCCDLRNRNEVLNNLCTRKHGGSVSGLPLSLGGEIGWKRSVERVFRESGKGRTTKVHARG